MSTSAMPAREAVLMHQDHSLHATGCKPATPMHTKRARCLCTDTPEVERIRRLELLASTVAWSRSSS